MALGVIFFVLIMAGIYLFVADPFQIKPIIKGFSEQAIPSKTEVTPAKVQNNIDATAVTKKSILTPSQEQMLQKIGVDPATIPSTITPTMEKCFYEKLGTKRADEIKAGAQPTATDVFMARSCI